mmetsp:Transcript_164064/g.398728  ORF Transcript_164064/g.398728 Transcript_164064/m.398728 type:complete len:263 (-) Transcript_164064:913-1701(-)
MMGRFLSLWFSSTPRLSSECPALSTEFRTKVTISSMIFGSSTGSCWSFRVLGLPVESAWLRLAISMMFMTRSRSREAQLTTILSDLALAVSASSSTRRSARPMMPCSGLRSSCETMAMKRALRVSASLKSSTSVKSQPMRVTPVTMPVLSRREEALSVSVAFLSMPLSMVVSTCSAGSPCSAFLIISRAAGRTSMPSRFTKSTPSASSSDLPVISAAFMFHWSTLPMRSIPKMGTLAVSMSLRRSSTTTCARTRSSSLVARS